MANLTELLPPIHLYAILVASMTLMVKALEFDNTDANRLKQWFMQWFPVSLVVVAWGHVMGSLAHQLLLLWRDPALPSTSILTQAHLTAHGVILIMFFLVGVAPCKALMAKAATRQHSLAP